MEYISNYLSNVLLLKDRGELKKIADPIRKAKNKMDIMEMLKAEL